MHRMAKRYDRAYFDRWYRGGNRVTPPAEVRRKVSLAVATAEYFLHRPIRSVLDVGCGEGAWFPHLRALRPRVAYRGIDPSPYVVKRFGQARNISRASFGDLGGLRLGGGFDLVVCSDVLHYVQDEHIPPGVAEIARLCAGVAFLEVLTREDDIIGDLDGLQQRPAAWYRSVFTAAGLSGAGPYCWLSPELGADLSGLQSPC